MEPEATSLPPPFDPYGPPQAPVGHEALAADGPGEPPPFFAVTRLKLTVMLFATVGVYQIYWFYKHWQQTNRWQMRPVSPLARAIFSILFAYSLFERVKRFGQEREVAVPAIGSGLLALAYLFGSFAWRLESPADFVGLLSWLPLVYFQGRVNALHAQLGHDPALNSRFTGWNLLAIVLGGLLWIFVVAGLFLPAEL
jgi:hypothetical protein